MRGFCRNYDRDGLGRRCLCVALLAGYLVTAAGVPLPLPYRPVTSGELFLCAASKCGCDSADRCWRSCCCHTLAERVAWARRHGVRPPEFALAKARAAGFIVTWPADTSATSQQHGACCEAPTRIVKVDCCQEELSSAVSTGISSSYCEMADGEQSAPQSDDAIVAWRAMKCRGQSTNWLAAVPTLILIRVVSVERPPIVERLGPAASDCAEGIADDPTVPPPELA